MTGTTPIDHTAELLYMFNEGIQEIKERTPDIKLPSEEFITSTITDTGTQMGGSIEQILELIQKSHNLKRQEDSEATMDTNDNQ